MDSSGGENRFVEDKDIEQSRADIARAREMIRALKASKKSPSQVGNEPADKPVSNKRIPSFEDLTQPKVVDTSWAPDPDAVSAELEESDIDTVSNAPVSDSKRVNIKDSVSDRVDGDVLGDKQSSSDPVEQTKSPEEIKAESRDACSDFVDNADPISFAAETDCEEENADESDSEVAALQRQLNAMGFAEDDDDDEIEEADEGEARAGAEAASCEQLVGSETDEDKQVARPEEAAENEQAVPQFNLADQILAQQRKRASAMRGAPKRQGPRKRPDTSSTLGKVIEKTKLDTVKPSSEREEQRIVDCAQLDERVAKSIEQSGRSDRRIQLTAPVLRIVREETCLSQAQKSIIAGIVGRDINRMCGRPSFEASSFTYRNN